MKIAASASSADMAVDTTALDRALGAIGTTFRLSRLYPPTHPALQESLRHLSPAADVRPGEPPRLHDAGLEHG